MKVTLSVTSGPVAGETYEFEEAGGFTFGRESDNTCVIPQSDSSFSRHHFLVEVNPPNVTLKDLGSLNGTFVNGTKHGGRPMGSAPEDGKPSTPVSLRDGDRIKAGNCEIELVIDAPALCVDCGEEIPRDKRKVAEFIGGTYLCKKCLDKEANAKPDQGAPPTRPNALVRRAAPQRKGLNLDQRKRAENDAAGVVEELMRRMMAAKPQERAPVIQGYTGLKKVGAGGFGVVYKAWRESDGKEMAIKTMLQTRKPPKRALMLFERECEIATQLRHAQIVHCEHAGQWEDIHFAVMEYMDGASVYDRMLKLRGKLALTEAAPIMLQSLEGLAHAHKARITVTLKTGKKEVNGVVHRDLKPPNILLAGSPGKWTAKVSDFGLAKAFSEAGMTKGAITGDVGSFCGSLPYMAPEHITNYRGVKPVTDVFEMAATFYHMLTGHTVWTLKRGVDPVKAVLEQPVAPVRTKNPTLSKPVADVLDQALSRDIKTRFSDAGDFLQALKKVV